MVECTRTSSEDDFVGEDHVPLPVTSARKGDRHVRVLGFVIETKCIERSVTLSSSTAWKPTHCFMPSWKAGSEPGGSSMMGLEAVVSGGW